MAPLPDTRIATSTERIAPFKNVGMDLAGPFYVKIGRSQVKRWILLICCMQYRCIHLEPVSSCDTDSFLIAFSKFISRRPRPESVRTDNAGNFAKGSQEIQELLLQLNMEKLQQEYPMIKWHFNPPASPHTGGFFERLIGIMKRSLLAILPPGYITDEEFSGITCVVEGIVNNRPLAKLPASDPRDPEALTPNHFLMGERYLDVAVLPAGQQYPYTRRWFHLQTIMDSFWRRFVAEIIPAYNVMNKWVHPDGEFKVGDVVLILEKNERGLWKLAIVEEVFPTERDNLIRRVKIRSNYKVYERSTHGLIQLLAIQ